MKKNILIIITLILLVSCDKKETKEFNLHLTGNIKGLKQAKLYIKQIKDSTLIIMDSITIDGDSKFESFLTIDSPEMLYLFMDRGETNSMDNSLPFFAESGKINIETSLETFYANSKITGSKNQELFEEFKKMNSQINNQQLDLIQEEIHAKRFNKVKVLDSVMKVKESLIKRKYLYTINFAKNKKDYEIAPYLVLTEVSNANLKYLELVNSSLTPKVANSKYGKMLQEFIEKRKKSDVITE